MTTDEFFSYLIHPSASYMNDNDSRCMGWLHVVFFPKVRFFEDSFFSNSRYSDSSLLRRFIIPILNTLRNTDYETGFINAQMKKGFIILKIWKGLMIPKMTKGS